ncbi:hypothetical protein GCM10009430_32000 [Aquimarina litoralis]|uniref:Uncharacterized protein n=1 Tax=Aquimarina litoralis TaxID=584605 RepID=A0ABP3U6Y6_9FLAO
MKNIKITTNYYLVIITIFFLFSSCEQERIEDTTLESNEEEQESTENFSQKGAFYYQGFKYYAGTGYDPLNDDYYPPAINGIKNSLAKQAINKTKVEVKIIENKEDYDAFTRQTTQRRASVFTIFNFRGKQKVLENKIGFSRNHVTAIVRINVQSFKYNVTKGSPRFNRETNKLLIDGKFDRFFRKHGGSYIDSQTYGGDVYYIYKYNTTNYTKEQKSNYKRSLENSFRAMFNINGIGVSNEQQQVINSNRLSIKTFTNVKNFTPSNTITNVNAALREAQKVKQHINRRPQDAAGIGWRLKSYAGLILRDTEAFKPSVRNRLIQKFENAAKCYQNRIEWRGLRSEILKLKDGDPAGTLFRNYDAALNYVDSRISQAQLCQNLNEPAPAPVDLINRYATNMRRVIMRSVNYEDSWMHQTSNYIEGWMPHPRANYGPSVFRMYEHSFGKVFIHMPGSDHRLVTLKSNDKINGSDSHLTDRNLFDIRIQGDGSFKLFYQGRSLTTIPYQREYRYKPMGSSEWKKEFHKAYSYRFYPDYPNHRIYIVPQ